MILVEAVEGEYLLAEVMFVEAVEGECLLAEMMLVEAVEDELLYLLAEVVLVEAVEGAGWCIVEGGEIEVVVRVEVVEG